MKLTTKERKELFWWTVAMFVCCGLETIAGLML